MSDKPIMDHDDPETHDWETCEVCIAQAVEDGVLSERAVPLPTPEDDS